jgi:hypothetical protein
LALEQFLQDGIDTMNTYTITVKSRVATIRELLDKSLRDDHSDQHDQAFHQGENNAEALGHAMFYLSTIDELEHGVCLDITQDE